MAPGWPGHAALSASHSASENPVGNYRNHRPEPAAVLADRPADSRRSRTRQARTSVGHATGGRSPEASPGQTKGAIGWSWLRSRLPRRPTQAFASWRRSAPKTAGVSRLEMCIQCGTCGGSCPSADDMDHTPRDALRDDPGRHADEVLRSNTPWMCVSCYHCVVRCPQERPHHGRDVHPQGHGRGGASLPRQTSPRLRGRLHRPGRDVRAKLGAGPDGAPLPAPLHPAAARHDADGPRPLPAAAGSASCPTASSRESSSTPSCSAPRSWSEPDEQLPLLPGLLDGRQRPLLSRIARRRLRAARHRPSRRSTTGTAAARPSTWASASRPPTR